MVIKSKKGQGALPSSSGNFLLIFLFVVLFGLGIFFVADYFSQVGENLPAEEERVVQACESLTIGRQSFCNQPRMIGKNKYVTCDYAKEKEGLTIEAYDNWEDECEEEKENGNREKQFIAKCDPENGEYKKGDLLNQYTCELWLDKEKRTTEDVAKDELSSYKKCETPTPEGWGGELKEECEGTDTSVDSEESVLSETSDCCVAA